jgi:glutamate carboxypeptidase
MAHKIVALHKLTDLKRGITVNVGLVKGGQSVNTTAPLAEGQIDLRYVKPEQRGQMLAALQEIIDTPTVAGTTATLEIKGEFLPVTATPEADALFQCYQAAAADAGLRVGGEFSGGCADSGFTAGVGCPTLCGVGPVGGNAHTPEEYLEVDTLVPRAQAMVLAVLRLPAP